MMKRLSVVITVYNRIDHLEGAIESVYHQLKPDSEIIVLNDGGIDFGIKKKIKEIASKYKGVELYQLANNLGHPAIFNFAISIAKGNWVHILHDDDRVKSGFYMALERGLNKSSVGMAFCRCAHKDRNNELTWTSHEERNTRGIIKEWVLKIFVECRIAFSSAIVKKDVYSSLGGFSKSCGTAFDWEMWKRIAVEFDVWFEPQILCACHKRGNSLTEILKSNGSQVSDSFRCIQSTSNELPLQLGERLAMESNNHYSQYAYDLAVSQFNSNQIESARRNLQVALRYVQSFQLKSKIRYKLREIRSSMKMA